MRKTMLSCKKVDAWETKRNKAKNLRYRKAIVKDINLDTIREELYEIGSECENVKWYCEEDDDTLINALDGDEDQVFEFKIMFCQLCAECERMQEDLQNEYVPECFNDFFVAIGAGTTGGGLLGWDFYKQDYFGLGLTGDWAEKESEKRLVRLTKNQLIEAAQACFKVLHAYLGIRHRYDCLKAALDILRDENTGYLQMVKKIENVYEKANEEGFCDWKPGTKELNSLVYNMPETAWIQ